MNKLIRDTGLMFHRSLTNALRNPIWLLLGLFQPLLYMLLFAPLLEGFMGGGALTVFVPGLLILTAMNNLASNGYGLIYELRAGVVERFRVTPVSRLALLLGRVLTDALVLLVQSLLLLAMTLLLGLRVDLLPLLLTLLLVLLVGIAMSSLSYGFALLTKDEGGLASITSTLWLPLLLLSGILLPLTAAPQTLKTLAAINPFTHIVDASRALFAGASGDPVIAIGFAAAVVTALLAVGWTTRLYRSATA